MTLLPYLKCSVTIPSEAASWNSHPLPRLEPFLRIALTASGRHSLLPRLDRGQLM